VKAGQVIAYVGESGTPESIVNPGAELHLHWELRIGDSYLGKGLPKDEVRRLYREAFSPP
jgi:murein DD-endopeptidase MepM/ murein hydrolase activator NlpD